LEEALDLPFDRLLMMMMKIPQLGGELFVADGQTDRRFSKFCERA